MTMKPYKDLSGDSGISAYECGDDYIKVEFSRGGGVYRYSYTNPGKGDVEKMKGLAESGDGLSAFISRYIRDRYEGRE